MSTFIPSVLTQIIMTPEQRNFFEASIYPTPAQPINAGETSKPMTSVTYEYMGYKPIPLFTAELVQPSTLDDVRESEEKHQSSCCRSTSFTHLQMS